MQMNGKNRKRMATLAAGVLFGIVISGIAIAGEAPDIVPQTEIQALERAIARELNTGDLGSQALGDLQRLLYRLQNSRTVGQAPISARAAALEPLGSDGDIGTLARLEREAEAGGRSALRSLAMFQLYMNNPEQSLRAWRKMGSANANDLSFQLLSSYLELALGNYNSARSHLETATRLIDTRTALVLSSPMFCSAIAGYRLYEERDRKELLPGDETLIYVEIEGADFKTRADGFSECRLMFGMKLKNDSQVTLWSEPNYGEYSPEFNGPIRDLHTALSWRVPNDLVPGLYRLHIEAEEEESARRGEAILEFTVAKRPTNPEQRFGGAGSYPPGVNDALREAQKYFPGSTPTFQKESRDSFEGKSEWERNAGYQEMIRKRTQME